jgi:predicted HTH domain antitoxin
MSDTVMLSFEINRDSLSALRKDPEHFLPEMRLAAAVKWYELGMLSQSKAAEVAGISRSEFLVSLSRFQVSPFQYGADEIADEVKR